MEDGETEVQGGGEPMRGVFGEWGLLGVEADMQHEDEPVRAVHVGCPMRWYWPRGVHVPSGRQVCERGGDIRGGAV